MAIYVDDNFDARSPMTDTLGSAPTGGDYTGDGPSCDIVSGRAVITHAAADNTVPRLLSATTAANYEHLVKVTTDKVPTGAEVQIRAALRMLDTANYYRVGIYPQTDQTLDFDAHPFVASVAGTPFITATHPSLVWSANTDYWWKIQIEGFSPTTIRMKVWAASGNEPSAWDVEGTDSEASLQAAGAYGFAFRTTSSVTNFPIAGTFDDWLVHDIPAPGVAVLLLGGL